MEKKNQIVDIMLDTAKGFHDIGFSCAAYLKNDTQRTVLQRTPVAAVNLSFSAELYLKAIHLLKRNPLKGHLLNVLFNSLDEKSKREIKLLFNKHLNEDPDSNLLSSYEIKVYKLTGSESETAANTNDPNQELELFLKRHNQTFENWRYFHEIGEEGFTLHADFKLFHCFITALQEFIFIHKRGNDLIALR